MRPAAVMLAILTTAGCGDATGTTNVLGRLQCTIEDVIDDGATIDPVRFDAVGLFTDDPDLWQEHPDAALLRTAANPTVFFAAKPVTMPSGDIRDFYVALAPGAQGMAILYAEYQREEVRFAGDQVVSFTNELVVNEVVDVSCESNDDGDNVPTAGSRHGLRIYEGTFSSRLLWHGPTGDETRFIRSCELALDPGESVQSAADDPDISCD